MALVSLIFFKRLGLLDASHPVSQPIQEPTKGSFVREFLRRVTLVLDQSLSHGYSRHARVRERGLEFRVDLALWIDERSNVLLQVRQLFFCSVPTACREILPTLNSAPQFAQPCVNRFPSPTKHGLTPPGAAATILQRDLRLKFPSSNSCQPHRRRLDGGNGPTGQIRDHALSLLGFHALNPFNAPEA